MLRTIMIGSCVSAQGTFEGIAPNGNILIRIGNRVYEGRPIAG